MLPVEPPGRPERRQRSDAGTREQEVPGKVFRDCTGCPEMVVIAAGEFTMGSPESEGGSRPG
jgi:formylglycine-generating enzyme required for sulfatase activity